MNIPNNSRAIIGRTSDWEEMKRMLGSQHVAYVGESDDGFPMYVAISGVERGNNIVVYIKK